MVWDDEKWEILLWLFNLKEMREMIMIKTINNWKMNNNWNDKHIRNERNERWRLWKWKLKTPSFMSKMINFIEKWIET